MRRTVSTLVFWVLLVLCIGYFTRFPAVTVVSPESTEMKLAIRTSGKRLGECTVLSVEEQGELSPNMRRPMVCPREKSPLLARVEVDGHVYSENTIKPSGLLNDGVVAWFETIRLPVGPVEIRISIKDDERVDGYTHEFHRRLELAPGRIVVVHFDDDGFRLTGA